MTANLQLVDHISNSYDEFPYASKPFPQTHPSFLRAVCSLFDVQASPVETANILEIGCSFGGNILPIAMQYPKANIVGLDLSEKQISIGKTAVKAMGLSNIQLQQQDITTYKTPPKHFDYIICHGVYSWVPEPVQKAIFRVISEGLTNNGVAIVSYNTYPGWKILEVYRDAMRYRGQVVDDIREKVKYGFGLLDFLKEHLPKESPWGVAIEQHYNNIRHADLSYVAHEYLELVNKPCYFHEFMSSAQSEGLYFIAESDFQNHFFPPIALDIESHQAIKREADGDVIKLEQLYDFLSNRTFRQTILTRQKNKKNTYQENPELHHDVLSELYIQGSFFKEEDKTTRTLKWKANNNPKGVAFKDIPIIEHIFTQLNAAGGQTLKVAQLWQEIQKNQTAVDKVTFFNTIAEIILQRAVKIRSDAMHWNAQTQEKPYVSETNRRLFQWMSKHSNTIGLSTVFHEPIQLDIIADELFPFIDGKHDIEALHKKLMAAHTANRVIFYDKDQQVIHDSEQVFDAVKEHTEKLLNILQYNGLLVSI